MQPAYVVGIAIVVAAVAAFIIVLPMRRWLTAQSDSPDTSARVEADLLVMREAKSALELRLAVEMEKTSRIPSLGSKALSCLLLPGSRSGPRRQIPRHCFGLWIYDFSVHPPEFSWPV